MSQPYRFADEILASDDPKFLSRVAAAHSRRIRPLCMCLPGRKGIEVYVARRFEKLRKTAYDAEAYCRFAVPFLEWHQRFIAAKKAAASRARWAKQKTAPAAAAKAHAAYQKRNKKSLGDG